MVRCSECGTENKESAKFCSHCGHVTQWACFQCQSPFQHGQAFCATCGVSLLHYCRHCSFENTPKSQFCAQCGVLLQILCSGCGKQNLKEARVCTGCAHPLANDCTHCGYQNLPGQTFCGSCHKQLREDGQLPTSPSTALNNNDVPPPESSHLDVIEPDIQEIPPLWREISPLADLVESRSPEATQPEEIKTEEIPEIHSKETEEAKASEDVIKSEANWIPPADLAAFALVSLEFLNLSQLKTVVSDPQQVAHFQEECLHLLERQANALGGRVETVHAHVAFVVFRQASSLEASIQAAIQWAFEILEQDITFQGHPLKLRFGLDIEQADQRNPLGSTAERSIAAPGTLVISEQSAKLMPVEVTLEQIGPLRMGNRMVTLYQVLQAAPPVQVSEEPLPPLTELLPEVPEEDAETETAPELLTDNQVLVEAEEAEEAEPEGIPEVPQPRKVITYTPPQYTASRGVRAPNLTYEQAYEALLTELKGFLDTGLEGKGRVLSLSASEGLGKSSIIRMALSQLNPDPQQVQAFWLVAHHYRAFEQTPLPLNFWLEWLQSPFGMIMEGTPKAEAQQIVGQALPYLYGGSAPEDVQGFMEDLLSIRDLSPITIQSRENLGQLEHYMGNFIATLASQKPVVLVMEDVHFADPASMDLLVRLIQRGMLEYPVFILLSHPRQYYADDGWGDLLQRVPYKEFVISDLNHEDALKFLKEGPLYGTFEQFPPPILETLIQQSAGLPLYLSEALRLLHLQGVLALQKVMVGAIETEKFVLAQTDVGLSLPALPSQITELAHARLRYLPEKTRYVLQLASVLGEKFPFGVLMQLCTGMEEQAFQATLKELYDHGWIVPDPVNTGRFTHGLLWHAVYHSIPAALREQFHQLVSEYLESSLNQQFAINPALMAYHAEKGGLLNRAFQYWNLAGVYATQVGSLVGVNLCLFRALALLPKTHTETDSQWEVRIQENLGILNLTDNPDLSLQLLEQTYQIWKAQNNIPKCIEALDCLASSRESVGRYHEALGYLEEALSLLSKEEYPLEYATMLTHQLEYLSILGKVQRAADLLSQEVEPVCAQRQWEKGSVYFNAYINSRLVKARILLMQCNSQAFNVLEEALGFAQEQDLLSLELDLKLVRSQGLLWKGNYGSCQRSLQSVLGQIEALDHPEKFLSQWGLWAMASHTALGEWENASLLIPNTLYQSEQANDYHTWMMASATAGHIAMGLGNLEDAKATLEKTLALSSEYRFATPSLLAWRYLADVELHLGAQAVAEEIATRALEVAQKQEIQNHHEAFLLTNLRARCLLARGELKEAGKILEAIWPQVIQTGFSPLIAQTASQIGNLYQALATSALQAAQQQKYLARSQEFYAKAQGIWKELGNPYQIQQIETHRLTVS